MAGTAAGTETDLWTYVVTHPTETMAWVTGVLGMIVGIVTGLARLKWSKDREKTLQEREKLLKDRLADKDDTIKNLRTEKTDLLKITEAHLKSKDDVIEATKARLTTKDEKIEAQLNSKDEIIRTKESHIQMLQDFTAPKLYEILKATQEMFNDRLKQIEGEKKHLEETVNNLQNRREQEGTDKNEVERQLQEAKAQLHEKQIESDEVTKHRTAMEKSAASLLGPNWRETHPSLIEFTNMTPEETAEWWAETLLVTDFWSRLESIRRGRKMARAQAQAQEEISPKGTK